MSEVFATSLSQIGSCNLPICDFLDSLETVETRKAVAKPPLPNRGASTSADAAITQPIRHFSVAQAVDFHVFGKSHVAHNGHMVWTCQAQNGERTHSAKRV